MKYVLLILTLVFAATGISQNASVVVCGLPGVAEFPGGQTALRAFLKENLVFPPSAVENKITGKCYISFTVSETGKVTDIEVSRKTPGCEECDAEAMRVMKLMPDWKPATEKGKSVSQMFNIPLTFDYKTRQ